MEKRVSVQPMSTEPTVRQVPKLNYGVIVVRVISVVAIVAALSAGPALLSGKLDLAQFAWPAPHWPNLALIGAASLAIKMHLVTVVSAAAVGLFLMLRIKGTRIHKQLGWYYMAAMFITGLVTLTIPRAPFGPHIGPFGPLHLFSLTALVGVPAALLAARRGNWGLHGRIMAGLFVGGIGIAGLGAFTPGRLMYQVLFG